MHLGKQARLVLDVHQHILRPHHIEGGRRKGHVEGIALPEGDPVVQPDAGPERHKELSSRVSDAIAAGGGLTLLWDDWGKRKLAYEIKKFQKGHYVLVNFLGDRATVDFDGVRCIMYEPDGGNVDPSGVTMAYAAGARQRGAEIHRFTPVIATEPQADGSLQLVAIENLVFKAGMDAAGQTAAPTFAGTTYVHMVDNPATPAYEAHGFEE